MARKKVTVEKVKARPIKQKAEPVVLTTIKLDAEASAALAEIGKLTEDRLLAAGIVGARLSRASLIRAAVMHYADVLAKG